MQRKSVWIALGAMAVLLLVTVTATRSRPTEVVVPEMVFSDSVPDPRAVGMCARNRASGTIEGVIVGLVKTEASEKLQFRVRSDEHPGAEYVMPAASVQVVKCDDPVAAAIGGRNPDSG
jgi:hypothetical protein